MLNDGSFLEFNKKEFDNLITLLSSNIKTFTY